MLTRTTPGMERDFGYLQSTNVIVSSTGADFTLKTAPGVGKAYRVWGYTCSLWDAAEIAGNIFHTSSSASNLILPYYANAGTTAMDNNNAICFPALPVILPENTELVIRATAVAVKSRISVFYTEVKV